MTILQTSTLAALLALLTAAFALFFKELVGRLPKFIVAQLAALVTTKVIVPSNSNRQYYDAIKPWIKAKMIARGRHNNITTFKSNKDDEDDENHDSVIPMEESIFLWFYGPMRVRWLGVMIGKELSHYHFEILMLGKDKRKVDLLEAEIKALIPAMEHTIEIGSWQVENSWRLDDKSGRSLDTIYMPKAQKDLIINDIQNFIDSKQWYVDRGIPHSRGILMSGRPGTGKSSMAKALAAKFERPIYLFNLSQFANDSIMLQAFRWMSDDCIILIEDIDSFDVAKARDGVKGETGTKRPKKNIDGVISRLSLSCLLNALDGMSSKEGCVLIMTSNSPESLDPALIRKGRIDLQVEFGCLEPENIEDMFKVFFEKRLDLLPKLRQYVKDKVHTASYWQDIFITYKSDPDKIFQKENL